MSRTPKTLGERSRRRRDLVILVAIDAGLSTRVVADVLVMSRSQVFQIAARMSEEFEKRAHPEFPSDGRASTWAVNEARKLSRSNRYRVLGVEERAATNHFSLEALRSRLEARDLDR